jgi:HPt (histidine-containing phosphotransfer) domain-containing protein
MPEELTGSNEFLIQRIITTFLTKTPLLKDLLAEAFAQNPDKLVQVAHKLKGQVAYFGVPELHTRIDQLEYTARRRNYQRCEPLLLSIRQQLEE